ncbi:MAG: hypothetical protein EVB11_05375 [Winogradskyella sp.]|nr:MAG: hypothetical protein EVB11_05375 [Winogradskyella sp.]
MKTIKLFTLLALFIGFSSCSSDDDGGTPLLEVESETFSNLHAPQVGGQGTGQDVSGAFTKFDFSTGQMTTSETDWDIAFRGTSIIVNGGVSLGTNDEPGRTGNAGAYIADGTFASISEVNISLIAQDSDTGYAIPSGSGNGWYLYNPQAFLITPIAGKILVFRTRDGKYAKVEILSYYENAPDNPDAMTDAGRYYTFNYIYQPNDGIITF